MTPPTSSRRRTTSVAPVGCSIPDCDGVADGAAEADAVAPLGPGLVDASGAAQAAMRTTGARARLRCRDMALPTWSIQKLFRECPRETSRVRNRACVRAFRFESRTLVDIVRSKLVGDLDGVRILPDRSSGPRSLPCAGAIASPCNARTNDAGVDPYSRPSDSAQEEPTACSR